MELLFTEDEREVFLYIQDRYDVWDFDEEWEKRGKVLDDQEEELPEASKEDLEFELIEAKGDDIYEINPSFPSFASSVRSSLQVGIVDAPQPRDASTRFADKDTAGWTRVKPIQQSRRCSPSS